MRDPKPNPWPGNPNAYECPWGCNGTGSMPWFAHIQGGICFSCKGEGWGWGWGWDGATLPQPQPRDVAANGAGSAPS
jgi:hypothetical protein